MCPFVRIRKKLLNNVPTATHWVWCSTRNISNQTWSKIFVVLKTPYHNFLGYHRTTLLLINILLQKDFNTFHYKARKPRFFFLPSWTQWKLHRRNEKKVMHGSNITSLPFIIFTYFIAQYFCSLTLLEMVMLLESLEQFVGSEASVGEARSESECWLISVSHWNI